MITAKNFWFWFSGIWLGVGLLLLIVGIIVGVSRVNLDALLDTQGRRAEGVVLTKEISPSGESPRVHRVTFDFATADGEAVRGSAELGPEAWDALVERGPIELTYLPDRPRTHRVPGEPPAEAITSLVLGTVGAVLAAIGAFVLLTARRKRRPFRRLTSHAPSHVGIGGDT